MYANAIERVRGKPASGQTVRGLSAEGRFLAHAAYSPASSIRARAWGFEESAEINAQWMHARIHEAVARRSGLQERTSAIRLVFGEADRLPGLVVDRYGDQLVVQFLAAGVEFWREARF